MQRVLAAIEQHFVLREVDGALVGVEAGIRAVHLVGDDALGRLVEGGFAVGERLFLGSGGGVEGGVEGSGGAGGDEKEDGEKFGFHSKLFLVKSEKRKAEVLLVLVLALL